MKKLYIIGLGGGGGQDLTGHGLQRLELHHVVQPGSALPDCDRAGKVVGDLGPDSHGGGHGQEHPVILTFELPAHLLRGAVAEQLPLVHEQDAGAERKDLLQAMLGDQHRRAQLPVDPPQGGQKVRGCVG